MPVDPGSVTGSSTLSLSSSVPSVPNSLRILSASCHTASLHRVALEVRVINYLYCLYHLHPLGGPGQMPHLAPTYAAVLALCTLGTQEAFQVINRPALQRFLLSLHQEDGSYIMHEDGEKDIR